MKNTAIESFCDRGIFFALCAAIFVLPASIAYLDSFVALAIFLYLIKKISRIAIDWPLIWGGPNFFGKINAIRAGFAPPENILDRPLPILVWAFFISVLLSQYPSLSLAAFIGKFIKCVFLYFCSIEVLRDEKRIRMYLKFFFLSAFIVALSGIVQHYTGKDFIKGHTFGTENLITIDRVNATFFTANGLGVYLLPVIALIAHFLYTAIVRHRSWVLGGVLALFLVLLLACLCWTYSRSSWVGYLVILFVMTVLDKRKILYAGALLLVFIFIFLPSLNDVRHMQLINDSREGSQQEESVRSVLEEGGSGRLAYWEKAVSIIRTSPVWGTGLNTYSRVIRRDPDQRTWRYAHNCYLQMTAETGFLGFFAFLWMLFVLLRHGLNGCMQIKDPWPLAFLQGAVSGLLGFLVQSFFDNTFYTVQLGIYMWLIFGLMVAVIRLAPVLKEN